MYLGTIDHDGITTVRTSRRYADILFVDTIKRWRTAGASVVLYVPGRADLMCETHGGEYEHYGIPCLVVSIQSDQPDIPHGWTAHHAAVCTQCKHHAYKRQCLCMCHA